MKLLPTFIAVLVVGTLGYLSVGFEWLESEPTIATFDLTAVELDQAEFYRQTIDSINSVRTAAEFPPTADLPLQGWLTTSATDAHRRGELVTGVLLEKLSSDLPQISTATACLAYGQDPAAIRQSVADWASQLDTSFNHFATHVFVDDANQQIGCAAIAVAKLRRFSPALVNEGERAFYSICRLCHQSHIGSIEQTHGAAALTCPHCQRPYELLSFKLDGQICRVNELLSAWSPPVRVPDTKTRLDEMFWIWQTVLERIRYARDLEGSNGNLDTWQIAAETWKFKNGDCEDSSILLADWLIARDFDARVVIGATADGEGHAWCVVRLDGAVYLLETTDATPDRANPPYAAKLANRYRPRFQFNRESVFFPNGESSHPRYWSSLQWIKLSAQGFPPEEQNL